MTSRQNAQPEASAGTNGAWVPRPLTPLQLQQLEDLRWAAKSPEVHKYPGQYVIVRKKRVIAAGNDCAALLKQAAALEQCPERELAVEVVPPLEVFEISPST